MDLQTPRLWFFDCDGVLLDSNRIKTEVFAELARPYGRDAADQLVEYHVTNGGVSRYDKWAYFFTDILGRPAVAGELEGCIGDFGRHCVERLTSVEEDPAAAELLGVLSKSGSRCHVVSGADERELRALLATRSFAPHLAAIWGSPRTKVDILDDLLRHEAPLQGDPVMVGDSRTDIDAAAHHGLDAIFVSHWTEMPNWETEMAERDIRVVSALGALLTEVRV